MVIFVGVDNGSLWSGVFWDLKAWWSTCELSGLLWSIQLQTVKACCPKWVGHPENIHMPLLAAQCIVLGPYLLASTGMLGYEILSRRMDSFCNNLWSLGHWKWNIEHLGKEAKLVAKQWLFAHEYSSDSVALCCPIGVFATIATTCYDIHTAHIPDNCHSKIMDPKIQKPWSLYIFISFHTAHNCSKMWPYINKKHDMRENSDQGKVWFRFYRRQPSCRHVYLELGRRIGFDFIGCDANCSIFDFRLSIKCKPHRWRLVHSICYWNLKHFLDSIVKPFVE